jgi:hypothetical protein
MLTGVTWWSTIEVIVLTTSNEPEIKEIIGSGATSIRIAKRDARRDRRRVFVMAGETHDWCVSDCTGAADLIREIPTTILSTN